MVSNKKVLVLGSTGRLGRLIKNKYENLENFDVIGVSRRLLNNYFYCKATNYEDLREFLIIQDPDLIINCAAMTNVDRCELEIEKAYKVNQKIPENIYNIIIKHNLKSKVVQISTDQVYKSKNFTDLGEEEPINIYGKTKLDGDKLISKIPNSLIFRTNFLWSVGKNNQINWLIEKCSAENRFYLFKDVICNPVHIDYLANFIIEKSLKDINGIFNLGSSNDLSKAEIFKKIANKLNLDITNAKEVSIDQINMVAPRPKIMSMNINRTESLFNIKLPNMDETLESLLIDYK